MSASREPTDRERLIDILGGAHGFRLPLRVGQASAIEQIYGSIIDAILGAGWEPTGLRVRYEASQGALTDLLAEHRELVEGARALADKWESLGFASRSGREYARELRDLTGPEGRDEAD